MKLAAILFTALLAAQDAPDEKIVLPTSAADLARGKALFMGSCTYCHGPTGDGGKGANLARSELVRAKTDADLVRIIEVGIPGTEMPSADHMVRREVLQTAAFVRTFAKVDLKPVPGSPTNGKASFAKLGCGNCHTIKQGASYAGGFMGPDLSSIGARRSPAHLRESVIDPGASLPEDFVNSVAVFKSGKTLNGLKLGEDAFNVVFRDQKGNNVVLPRSDLKEVKTVRNQSPMPSFRDKLSASELDDLVAYLVSLKETM